MRGISPVVVLVVVVVFSSLLGGCVGVPCAANSAVACYPAVATAPAAAYPYPYPYPAAPPPQADLAPDGFGYVDGVPIAVVGGEQVGIVYEQAYGGWGYYDRSRRWHGAPGEWRERLERSRQQDRGRGGFRAASERPPEGEYRGGQPRGGFRGGPGGPPPEGARRPPPPPGARPPPPPAARQPPPAARGCPQCTN